MVTASCYFLALSVHAKSLIKNTQVLLKNLKCVVENAKSRYSSKLVRNNNTSISTSITWNELNPRNGV